MEKDPDNYEFSFDINAIYLLKGVVDYALQMWPGAPARPYEEQEFLSHLQKECNRCIFEYSFNNNDYTGDK